MSAIDKKFQSKNFKNWSNSDLKLVAIAVVIAITVSLKDQQVLDAPAE